MPIGDLDYRLVLDSFSDAVVASDGSDRIRYVNAAVERLLGWKRDELLGQPLTTLMPPRMHAAHEAGFHRFIQSHQPRIIGKPVRVPALHRDGTERDIELTLTAFPAGTDNLDDLIVASMRDLRDRVELERHLASQRHLLAGYGVMTILTESKDFAEAAPRLLKAIAEALAWDVGIFWGVESESDRLGAQAFWNSPSLDANEFISASRGLRFAMGEGLPGQAWQTRQAVWTLDAGNDHRYRRAAAAARTGLQGAFLFPVFCAKEPHGVMEFISQHPREPDADLLGTMASIGFQIGQFLERIRTEAELRQANDALKRERDNLQTLFVHAPAAVAVLRGPDFRYELSNPINQRYAGGRELVGKTVVEALPELEAQGLTALAKHVYETGQPFVGKEVPVSVRQPDGSSQQMYLNGMYQPLRDESGQVNGIMAFAYDVTEQVLARRRAEEAVEAIRQFAESIPAMAWSTDAAGNAHYYNTRWYEYTGLPAGSVSPQDWARPIHPDDVSAVGAKWALDRDQGRPFEAELRLRRASDGAYRWHLARAAPVKDREGNVTGWFGASVDVDDVKRATDERNALLLRAEAASNEAKAQREWLNSILTQAPVAIALYRGPKHVIELANPLMCRIWGRSPEAVLGKFVSEALPEMASQGIVEDTLDSVFATGVPYFATEMPVKLDRSGTGVLEDGAFNFVHVPLVGPDGAPEGIVAVASEVTEQMFSRKRIETLMRELGESEAQFRTLANSIPQLAWIAEPNGDIHWYNQRWYDYTGTTLEEMEDESGWGWKKVHDPAELPRVMARFKSAVASGEPWEDTFPLRRRDGTFRWHLSRAMPVRDAQERIVRWFGTNTDVEDSRQQAAALQEAIEVRDNFLSVAGHELRTPLAAMMLHIQSLERKLQKEAVSPRTVERLEKASDAGLRLSGLVDKLLDVSRIHAGRLALELEPVDFAALVREVVDRHSEQAVARGITIRVDAPDQLVGTWDKTRLDQMVTNLLTNAVKYGNQKPVEVTAGKNGDGVFLSVTDHGIGIAPEALDRIFQRFERAALSTDYGGIGLGLWITRQIVEVLGGRIEVRSRLGEGSSFTVVLPMRSQGDVRVS